MRITMEPTQARKGEEFPQHKVIIELPSDDLDINQAGDLLRFVLLGWGFDQSNVDEIIAPS